MVTARQTGRPFEHQVFLWLERALTIGDLPVQAGFAKVLPKPSYFSQLRARRIHFDCALEIARPAATQPWLVWIWECKDLRRPVEPGHIEKLSKSIERLSADGTVVVATKATLASRGPISKSAEHVARQLGVGLVEFDDSVPTRQLLEAFGGTTRPTVSSSCSAVETSPWHHLREGLQSIPLRDVLSDG